MDRTIQLLTDMWNRLQNEHHNVVTEENYDALKKAIQALEQTELKPSYNSVKIELDAISRQDAIRLAEQGQIQGYEWQFKKLVTLPSAQPEPKTCVGCVYENQKGWRIDVCGGCVRNAVDYYEQQESEVRDEGCD